MRRAGPTPARGSSKRSDGVVLLHGIGRGAASMARLAAHLEAAGFCTLNLDYPSRTRDLAALADFVEASAGRWCERLEGRVHLVTHSMGGLVAGAWISRHRPERLGRIVMLATERRQRDRRPPIPDARLSARLGPAGAQLGTRRDAAALLEGPLECEVGIIAGTRALDPLG